MNSFGYGYVEPVVPPRRKRSLSTSRTDTIQAAEDSHFGFPNRMKRNFSTEHIPGQYFNAQRQQPGNYLQQHYRQQSQQPSLLFQQTAQGQIPRFVNPHAPHMSKMPIRPHHDYLKYGQGVNVPYNPYTSPFNPTLMARPTIEPFQSTSIPSAISNAIARGRDPALYSSKEKLHLNSPNLFGYEKNFSHSDYGYNLSKSPPQRPPPPKLNPRSSLDNLHSMSNHVGIIDFQAEYPSRNDLHNRRSVSPTRLSPTGLQKPYNIRRTTSPIPSSLITARTSSELRRSPSQMSPNQNYQFRTSREQSPLMSRSPSPLQTSPYSYATNQLCNSYEHQPVSHHQTSNRVSRSSIFGAGAGGSANNSYEPMNQSNSYGQSNDQLNGASMQQRSNNLNNNYGNQSREFNLENNAYANDNQIRHNQMNSLQVPTNQQDFYNQDNPNSPHQRRNSNTDRSDPMFSETFTDHCDQYKSLTSKILSKKSKQANSDFNDDNYNLNEDFALAKDMALPRKLSAQIVTSNQGKIEMATYSELANNLPGNSLTENNLDDGIKKVLNDLVETNVSSKLIDPVALNQLIRRSSTSNGLTVQQRKGSLPSQYIAAPKVINLSDEWSRENVASMAHEARTHGKQSHQGSTLKKIGVCLTRQFIFLLIAGLNILLAYVFYNLLSALPKDETIHKR